MIGFFTTPRFFCFKEAKKFGQMKCLRYLCKAKRKSTGEYQSGQMGQTVNLLVFTFGGSNPSSPTF